MKKIIVVGPSLNAIGGITSFLNGMLNSPLNKKFKFIYFDTFKHKGRGSPQRSIFSFFEVLYSFKVFIEFLFLIFKEKDAVVYLNTSSYWGFWEKSILIFISKLLGRNVFLTVHGAHFSLFYKNSKVKFAIRFFINLCEKVSFVSSDMHTYFKNILSLDTLYIPNPVSVLNEFDTLDMKECSELQSFMLDIKSKYQYVFLSLSLLEDRKKVLEAIREFNNIDNACLVIAGDGPERSAVELLIASKKNVFFLGPLQSLQKDYAIMECDVFIQNSNEESFCITIIESLLHQKVLLTTRVGVLISDPFENENVIYTESIKENDYFKAIKVLNMELSRVEGFEYAKEYSWESLSSDFISFFSN